MLSLEIANAFFRSVGWAGIWAVRVAAYRRKAGFAKHARAISARSYALVNWPGPSSPDGVTAWVCRAPSRCASSFIARTPPVSPSGPPPRRASAFAASLPERSSSPSQIVSIRYRPPSTSPTAELPGSTARSPAVTVTSRFGSSRGSIVAASSSFWTLAGTPYSCGPQPPSTAPLSRSATTQEVAVTAGGADDAGGTTSPAVSSAAPPTARAAGSGAGGGCGGRVAGGGTFGQGGADGSRRAGVRTPATAGVADTGTSRAAASATKGPQVLMTRTLATPTRTGHRLRDSCPGAGATR